MLSMLLFTGSVFIDKAEGRGGKLRDPVRARPMHSDCGHLFAKAVRGSDHRVLTPPRPLMPVSRVHVLLPVRRANRRGVVN